jgi:hypothetical protein
MGFGGAFILTGVLRFWGDAGWYPWAYLAFGGIVLAAGVNTYRSRKNVYSIVLTTVTGETKVMGDEDKGFIDQVLTALNNAIKAKG